MADEHVQMRRIAQLQAQLDVALAELQWLKKRRIEGETMKWSLWRMVVALTIAVVLVVAARHFGWLHTPITVE